LSNRVWEDERAMNKKGMNEAQSAGREAWGAAAMPGSGVLALGSVGARTKPWESKFVRLRQALSGHKNFKNPMRGTAKSNAKGLESPHVDACKLRGAGAGWPTTINSHRFTSNPRVFETKIFCGACAWPSGATGKNSD